MSAKKPKAVKAWLYLQTVPIWRDTVHGFVCTVCGLNEHSRDCWVKRLQAILRPLPKRKRARRKAK